MSEITVNLKNKENIGDIVRDKRTMTIYLYRKILLSGESSFIKGSKKAQQNKILF